MALRTRRQFRYAAIPICTLLLISAATKATSLARLSVAKMTHASQIVFRGRCLSDSAEWDAGEIWTFTTFEPIDVWKGSTPSRVRVRLLGGTAGNITSSVSGVPRFHMREEVVLFLQPTKHGDFSVVSWVQGTFRIQHDRRTGEDIVTQDSAAFGLFDPATRQFNPLGIRGLPLATLRGEVVKALREETGEQK